MRRVKNDGVRFERAHGFAELSSPIDETSNEGARILLDAHTRRMRGNDACNETSAHSVFLLFPIAGRMNNERAVSNTRQDETSGLVSEA